MNQSFYVIKLALSITNSLGIEQQDNNTCWDVLVFHSYLLSSKSVKSFLKVEEVRNGNIHVVQTQNGQTKEVNL